MAITLNIYNMCKTGFNAPVVEGCPLYKNVEGYRGEESLAKYNMSERLIKNLQTRYNSPDNVRRLFITYKKIIVEFYKPVCGEKNNKLTREIVWARSSKDNKGKNVMVRVDMREAILDIIGINRNNQEQPKYKMTGNPFRGFISPYVLQNIEEIYFDASMLISDTIMNSGLGGQVMKLLKNKDTEYKDTGEVEAIFNQMTLNGKDIRRQFPRLKAVGYISSLGDIYDSVQGKPGIDSIEDMKGSWLNSPVIQKEIKNPKTNIKVYKVDGVPALNTSFSVKEGIYEFDRVILAEYKESLQQRVDRYFESERAKKVEEKKIEAENTLENEKSELEVTLDKIYDLFNGDESKVKSQVTALFLGRKVSEKERELKLMSKQGKERYGKYIK